MKNFVIATFCLATIVYVLSCSKSTVNEVSCTNIKAVADSGQLLAFANKYGIQPVADTSWLYYQITNAGTGATPTLSSILYVRYAGRLMDGTYFDSTAITRAFALGDLIKGWQYGLPKIKAGGSIKLLVPSALAYGCQGNGTAIPSNAPVYFNIYLDSLK